MTEARIRAIYGKPDEVMQTGHWPLAIPTWHATEACAAIRGSGARPGVAVAIVKKEISTPPYGINNETDLLNEYEHTNFHYSENNDHRCGFGLRYPTKNRLRPDK